MQIFNFLPTLPLGFVFALSACGGGGGGSGSSPGPSPTPSSAATSVAESSATMSSEAASSELSSADASSTPVSSVAASSLSSVPASSAGASSSPTSGEEEISAEKLRELSLKDGVWRIEFVMPESFTAMLSFDFDGTSYPYEYEVKGSNVSAAWVKVNHGTTEITEDSCDEDGVTTHDGVFADGEGEGIDLKPSTCELVTSRYFKLSENEVRTNTYCDGKLYTYLLLTKLSSAEELALGSFNLNASPYPNTTTPNKLCGGLSFTTTKLTFVGDVPDSLKSFEANGSQKVTYIRMRAPYGSDYLNLDFHLHQISTEEELLPGVYTYGAADKGLGYFDVSLSSREFHVEPEGETSPLEMRIIGGTLTINSASKYSATGSYSLTGKNGETFNGDFALDLNK